MVVYPLGVEVDLQTRGWELILLNDPQGGVATMTSAGAVKFTPTAGFVGASTIHFVIEDRQGQNREATLTVEVQNQFAFDIATTANNGTARVVSHSASSQTPDGICSKKVLAVIAAPTFSGTAVPAARLIGRIYSQCGELIGEATATADDQGQWKIRFVEPRRLEFYRVEFEQLATSDSAAAAPDAAVELKADDAAYQLL